MRQRDLGTGRVAQQDHRRCGDGCVQFPHSSFRPSTAREIQRRWHSREQALRQELSLENSAFGLDIGIGIHCGELSFGEFGHAHRDLTAIGTVVNMAARAQAAAAPGQILVSREMAERAQSELADARAGSYQLKGFDSAIDLYAA
jgi:adenylate cyclase